MKPDVRFNHDAHSVAEALGIKETAEQMSDAIAKAVQECMIKDHGWKHSKLAEALHENLSYETILFLATKEVQTKLTETLSDMEEVDKLIKAMDELIEKIEIEDKAKLN